MSEPSVRPMAPVEEDDAALIVRLRTGENAAYEQLIRTHAGRMLAVARRFLQAEADAQEVVQEAFVSAFKSIDRFEGNAKLSTWLHRITVNAALMRIRQRTRRPERSIEELLPAYDAKGHRTTPISRWHIDEQSEGEKSEIRLALYESMAQLPASYRDVLVLRDIEELSTDETANVLKINPGAVKTRLHRARQALRELLEGRLK